jgi:hypothetical protein
MAAFCRYHCRCCGSHFSSLEAFDAHRPRNLSRGGCEWPEDAPLVELSGSCEIGDPDRPVSAVTLYSTERSARARDYFQGENGPQALPAKPKEAVAA